MREPAPPVDLALVLRVHARKGEDRARYQQCARHSVYVTWGLRAIDASLCHGWADLVQVAVRMAADSVDGETFAVSKLAGRFTAYLAQSAPATSPALLDGQAGIQLAQLAATTGNPPDSRWDASLLLGA